MPIFRVRARKRFFHIIIDGEYAFKVPSVSILEKAGIYDGLNIEDDKIQEVLKYAYMLTLKAYSLDSLARKDKSAFELKQYLRKRSIKMNQFTEYSLNFDVKQLIENVIADLKENRLINELRYAENYINSKLNKGLGLNRILNELRVKGININKEQLREMDIYQDNSDKISSLIEKKIGKIKAKDNQELRSKLIRYLASRGFDYGDYKNTLDELINS